MANNRSKTVNIPVTFLTFVIVAALFAVASYRVNIDFDILNSLPVTGPVLSDAKYVISHHPFQDRIVIDISHQKVNPEVLANGADFLESRLKDSGLFEQVGIKQTQHLIPELLSHVVSHPQVMFTEEELNRKIKPLLTRERINGQLEETLVSLSNIEGIGQARMIAADPLGFRNIALEKLAHLAPIKGAGIYKGYPISPDNAHMLIIVNPKASGTDTSFSRQITHLFESVSKDLNEKFAGSGYQFTLTPVGGYRAALDNENIVKKDTQRAILFATLGIALLLIVSFPRPLIGLLALVPAFIGTIGAFFVCSFLYDSISILAIGFGGAIISITVDHSIAYLLFLDRPRQMKVSEAAGEVRSIGLIAMLTTVGAFLTLSISGFPVLLQIGQFAALGILFSFVFVHTVFPLMNPVMPPAKKNQVPILRRFVNWMSSKGQNQKAFLALAFAVLMMFFAKLDFNSDLQSMNTISKATSDAEALIGKTWGNVFTRIFLLVEGETVADLQKQGDKLTKMLATDAKAEIISSAFIPSMFFPGEDRTNENLDAWQRFWTQERILALKIDIQAASSKMGFEPEAFSSFYEIIETPTYKKTGIPAEFHDFFGITNTAEKGKWIQFSSLTPGEKFAGKVFFSRYSNEKTIRIFEPGLFSAEFGELLSSTFQRMMIIIGISVVLLLYIFFFDLKLVLISILPILFALFCTLGTLNLLGHPLDIPALMLGIIVFGMGIDYSLFFVRSYQRYGDEEHESLGLIRMAVFLASMSTMIGFGALAFAEHSLLRSAGLTSLLGIGYSMLGAFFILPPILKKMFMTDDLSGGKIVPKGKTRFARVVNRYAKMETHARMFARFKMKLDPMFSEIERLFETPPGILIDIGCGYGVPASWMLDCFPDMKVYGLEPDPERVRVASMVMSSSGTIVVGSAPDIPEFPDPADAAVMLDMLHYLDDSQLEQTLLNLHAKLKAGGALIIRVTVPSGGRPPFYRWVEMKRMKIQKLTPYYRAKDEVLESLKRTGFSEIQIKPSGTGREEIWFVGKTEKK